MLPGTKDIEIYRGDTKEIVVRLRAGLVEGDYIDLTGRVPKAEIRADRTAPTALAEFTCTLANQSDAATKGGMTLKLTPAQTRPLPDTGVWDLQLTTTATGDIFTYLVGTVTATDDVTR